MPLHSHLHFNGQCEAAFKLYEKCLGAKITMMMAYGESPMAATMPKEFHQKIIHADLQLGNYQLTGADVQSTQYQRPQGFSVMLNVNNAAEAEQAFKALSENGVVQMPIQKTFWTERFGMLVDQFGIPWTINAGGEQ